MAEKVREISLRIYPMTAEKAYGKGIIIADTNLGSVWNSV